MSVESEAIRLHSLGWDPIPLVPGEKRPLHADWQKRHGRSPEQVAEDFRSSPGAGLGLLTGRGRIVLDADYKPDEGINGQASLAELAARLGPLPKTVTARTASGGMHYWFTVPVAIRNSVSKLAPGVDVRGEGGQVVVEPTVLADGREYHWLEQARPGFAEVAELPARWVEALQALEAERAAPVTRVVAPAPGRERLVAPVVRVDGLARARAYLAQMPPAISGSGGHAKTFDAVCRIVERVTSEEDAWTVLCEYNERCQPPWSERELRHKLDDALSRHALASSLDEALPAPVAARGEGSASAERPVSSPASASPPPAVGEPEADEPGGDEPEVLRVGEDDEDVDRISESDNLPYWLALRSYNTDRPGEQLPEVLDDEQAAFLKRTERQTQGAGRPATYLAKSYDLLSFRAERPSRWAFDEHLRQAPWRRFHFSTGEWGGGVSQAAAMHYLEHAGLNARSCKEFLRRTRHAVDARHVYDADLPLVRRDGRLFVNLYEPSTLQPQAGDWADLRSILLNLHSGNEEHLRWTLDWLSTVVRDVRAGKPDRTGVAVVFYGPAQGAGKGVFGEVIRAILGERNVVTIRQQELDEPYNGWFGGRLFVIANEVFSSDNRTEAESNRLKPLISDPTVQVREMYAAPVERANVSNWVLFSNNLRPVVVEGQDRRFTLFKVGGAISPELGARVAEDARAGGPAVRAFLHELMTREVSVFRRYTALTTAAKSEVQYDTGSSAEKFVADLLGDIGFHGLASDYLRECGSSDLYAFAEDGEVCVARKTVYEVYRRWASAAGYKPLGSSQLYRLLESRGIHASQRRAGGRKDRFFAGLPGVAKLGEETDLRVTTSGATARFGNIEQATRILGGA